tara:strand:+ start:28 stop:138 length:111 start_codon:yes stop_codon:yes gene_type:complete
MCILKNFELAGKFPAASSLRIIGEFLIKEFILGVRV